MNQEDINQKIQELSDEMQDLGRQMDELEVAKEYNPGETMKMTSYSDLIKFSILRKRQEIAEFEHANMLTYRETGKRPDHYDSRINALKEEINRDEEELKALS